MKTARTAFLIAAVALAGMLVACFGDGNPDCDESLCLGLLFPASDGLTDGLVQAAKFARDDINAAGGDVEIVFGDGEDALSGARGLAARGVRGIVGPSFSSKSEEIFDFVTENELVAVSPSATSVSLTERNEAVVERGERPFFFRTAPHDGFHARLLAGLIDEGKALVVHREDAFGTKLAELIAGNLESLGKSSPLLVAYDPYDDEDPDAADRTSAAVDRVERLDGVADAVSVVVIAFDEGAMITKALLDSRTVPDPDVARYYMVGFGYLAREIDPSDPAAVDGFLSTGPAALSDPPERTGEFDGRFDERLFPVRSYVAHAYDAVVVMALASLSAGSASPSEYVSEMAAVTKEGTKCRSYRECAALLGDSDGSNDGIDYEGISGPIEFDENGDVGAGFYSVFTHDADGDSSGRIFSVPGLNDVTP